MQSRQGKVSAAIRGIMHSRFRRGFAQFFSWCPWIQIGHEPALSRSEAVTSRYSCAGSPEIRSRISRNGTYKSFLRHYLLLILKVSESLLSNKRPTSCSLPCLYSFLFFARLLPTTSSRLLNYSDIYWASHLIENIIVSELSWSIARTEFAFFGWHMHFLHN
jgi:hypothetical protein